MGKELTRDELDEFKEKLRNYCIGNITDRLATAEALVQRAQDSANNEGKSSAGDKYETGRSMGQLEKNMYLQQVAEIKGELAEATAVSAGSPDSSAGSPDSAITRGSLVVADQLFIFICAGLGKKEIDGRTVLFISFGSPLFKTIRGLRSGERFRLKAEELVVEQVI